MANDALNYLTPVWPAPSNVKAYVSTRHGGVSEGPYGALNLGAHVGDELVKVQHNRRLFSDSIAMPDSLVWLNQVHGVEVAELPSKETGIEADAATTTELEQVCAVLTADCLPVFFCNKQGSQVAVAHAGWRGLCSGVLEQTLARFESPDEVIAWLGPAIGASSFEVGGEVREAFMAQQAEAELAFTANQNGKWLGDLYLLARQRLIAQGISQVFGGDYCTYQEEAQFFSYRRDGVTGRMASVIWLDGSLAT